MSDETYLGFPLYETATRILRAIPDEIARWPDEGDYGGNRFSSGHPSDDARLNEAISEEIKTMLDERFLRSPEPDQDMTLQ